MIEKIKSALKIKYSHLGLSEEALNGAASLVSITVTEEPQIAGIVDKMEPALKGIQSDVDRRVNGLNGEKIKLESEKLELQTKLDKITPPATPPVVGEQGDEIPDYLKGLIGDIKGLKEERVREKQLQNQSVLRESAKKLMIKKGVKDSSCDLALDSMIISEGETAETLAGKGVEKFNSLESHFTSGGVPPRSPQAPVMEDGDFDKMMDKIAEESGI